MSPTDIPVPHREIELKSSLHLRDRVLAEAVAAHERLRAAPLEETEADRAARSISGDFEQRIIARASRVLDAPHLIQAIQQSRQAIGWVILAALLVAAVTGAAAARAALSSPHNVPVNFFWALGVLLALQTMLLVLWFALLLFSRRLNSQAGLAAPLGAAVFRLAQYLMRRLHRGPHHAAALAAIATVNMRGAIGKWTLSAVSHGFWLAFNLGCLFLLILLLSARQHVFAWETTILSQQQYVPLTQAIAAAPQVIGFDAPTADQIVQSQWNGVMTPAKTKALASARHAWSYLLVGCIVVYAAAPRALLLVMCLYQRARAGRRYRLDTSRPEFSQLHSRLMPIAQSIGVIDEDASADVTASSRTRLPISHARRPVGLPAIMALELPAQPAKSSWPPALHNVRWIDLGPVDHRDDQRRVLQQLRDSTTEPSTTAIVAALTATPDRGIATFLGQLQEVVARPLTLILTSGQSLRQRTDATHLAQRIDDWRRLGHSVGVSAQRIVEVDLDHLTQTSAAKLAAIINDGQSGSDQTRVSRIEEAFDLIADTAARWSAHSAALDAASQVELHRGIANLYKSEPGTWQALLGAPASLENFSQRMKTSADRFVDLLPSKLRQSPKWLAAGALAGALGCVAAATLVAPAAIAALPLWSSIGAGIAALAHASRGSGREETTSPRPVDLARAVRAAALFAMLLELQGRDEAEITRILDQIVQIDEIDRDDASDLKFTDAQAVRRWLAELRHRLDIALAVESGQ